MHTSTAFCKAASPGVLQPRALASSMLFPRSYRHISALIQVIDLLHCSTVVLDAITHTVVAPLAQRVANKYTAIHKSQSQAGKGASKVMCTYDQQLLGLAVHGCAGTPIPCPAQGKLATIRKYKLHNKQEVQASEVVKPINEGC